MANVNKTALGLGTQRSVIRELFEFGKKRIAEVGAENVFDFSIGNPSVPAPEMVNETAVRLLQEMDPVLIHSYTSAQGDAQVREKIAQSIRKRFDYPAEADSLYMSTGAAGALCCCLNGLLNPGEEVIVFAPFFPEYKVFIEGAGGVMKLIPADVDAFQIDFDRFEEALSPNTKAVIVNSPNNPSGAVYSEETVQRLAKVLTDKSAAYGHVIYLITDEPYREIAFSGVKVPYVPKYYPNTLVCYSWSKSLSLPGERMGYVQVAEDMEEKELVYAAVAGAGRFLGYVSAPSLFQRVCAQCVDETSDISVYERNKDILVKGLREIGFTVVEPQGTFYMFPRTLIEDDVAFCEKAKDFNLLIVPGTGFGCPGHTRISYCVPTERAERSLEAFAKLAAFYR